MNHTTSSYVKKHMNAFKLESHGHKPIKQAHVKSKVNEDKFNKPQLLSDPA